MSTLNEIIATHPFTKGLDPKHLQLLLECATHEHFTAYQQIFRESFEANRFYLVHSGKVELQTFFVGHGVTTIQTVGPNEALGWSWLFPPYCWHFSATAIEPGEAVAFCAKSLRESMEKNHDFGYAIAMRVGQLMLERLQATRLRHLKAAEVAE